MTGSRKSIRRGSTCTYTYTCHVHVHVHDAVPHFASASGPVRITTLARPSLDTDASQPTQESRGAQTVRRAQPRRTSRDLRARARARDTSTCTNNKPAQELAA